MASQIIFFEKNIGDIGNSSASVVASQGNSVSNAVRDRSNNTAWVTTGSVDSDNTTFEMDFGDVRTVTNIILVKHNFKAYTLKYWNGSAWTDFATPISVTGSTTATTRHVVSSVMTNKILLTITGTQTANADKYMYQMICTTLIGQLLGWPMIKSPTHTRNRKISTMLSGKTNLSLALGSFSCDLQVAILSNTSDIAILETLYTNSEGTLVWLCGGDEAQFTTRVKGYRLEDLFLMRPISDYKPEWAMGLYKSGLVAEIKFAEVVS